MQEITEHAYLLSLLKIPGIGIIQGRILLQHFSTGKAVFEAPPNALRQVEGMSRKRISALKSFKDFSSSEKEALKLEQSNIFILPVNSNRFPVKLTHCYDCPPLLFYRGNADLNSNRMLGVVGTRTPSLYGKHVIETFFEGFGAASITIVSGLAYGIDTLAHRAALKFGLPTIGVLGHGLDQIYPSVNLALAREMFSNGGLITEFPFGTKPDRQNFPRRNRIVAGMCDALLIIESGEKGGSMITASLSQTYNRDVFACPGKITDEKSRGCNELIKTNRAMLVNSFEDILEAMNWKDQPSKSGVQKSLFLNLTADEQKLYEVICQQEETDVDDINLKTGFNPGKSSQILLMLEMNGLINRISGNRYKIPS